jgi:NADH-quinone oxidoreductase subunit H
VDLIQYLRGPEGLLSGWSYEATLFIVVVQVAVIVITFLSLYAGITSVVERKMAGRIQTRLGPNKVWFRGLFQFIADGLKILQKEDIIPHNADKPMFRIAPYIVFTAMFMSWVALPFGRDLIAADVNIGILYIFAVTSLVVVGILLAGWASNNKWSLIGGVRSAAQIVSYEIPSGLSALAVVLLAGSLSMQSIIQGQGAAPWQWYIAHNPFTFIAFFVFFISLLAEGNRVPFDLPEGESELVSGYNTEYSGMRFLLFFFAEWANIWVMSAIITTLFLGGWQTPWVVEVTILGQSVEVIGVLLFAVKSLVLSFLIIQLRWTLPRLRVDQLMGMCWKYLVPISFVNILGVLIWMVIFPQGNEIASYVMAGILGLIIIYFFYRVIVVNLIKMKADIDLKVLQ